MKRSEQIRKIIEIKEENKIRVERYAKGEVNIFNKQIVSLNRELNEIRNGGKLDEEI